MGESKRNFDRRKTTIKRAKKLKKLAKLALLYLVVTAVCVSGIWLTVILYDHYKGSPAAPSEPQSQPQSVVSGSQSLTALQGVVMPGSVSAQFIDLGVARTGAKLQDFNAIVIHYTGDPGVTAAERREYYIDPNSSVSTHFIVGTDGKTLMCLPIDEQANATGPRNSDTISIEYCHTSYDGLMSKETYTALVELCATILKGTGKGTDCLLRHYDINSSAECPQYYISHNDAWNAFKADVEKKMK